MARQPYAFLHHLHSICVSVKPLTDTVFFDWNSSVPFSHSLICGFLKSILKDLPNLPNRTPSHPPSTQPWPRPPLFPTLWRRTEVRESEVEVQGSPRLGRAVSAVRQVPWIVRSDGVGDGWGVQEKHAQHGELKKGVKHRKTQEQSIKGRHSRFHKNEQFAFSLKKRDQSQKRYLAL